MAGAPWWRTGAASSKRPPGRRVALTVRFVLSLYFWPLRHILMALVDWVCCAQRSVLHGNRSVGLQLYLHKTMTHRLSGCLAIPQNCTQPRMRLPLCDTQTQLVRVQAGSRALWRAALGPACAKHDRRRRARARGRGLFGAWRHVNWARRSEPERPVCAVLSHALWPRPAPG